MTGKLYIDDKDAFAEFGVFVQDGGYRELVQWPALKTVDVNDWPEEDGVDPDLDNPKLSAKEFSVSFCCVDPEKTVYLFRLLSDKVYHTFMFDEIGIEKELRLVSQPSNSILKSLQVFSLQFADDDYMAGYEKQTPVKINAKQGYEIDGVDISEYGIRILRGTYEQLQNVPNAKNGAKVDVAHISGVIHDEGDMYFQSSDITLKCLLRTSDMETFWGNYLALLYDLAQPAERTLHVTESDEYYGFYYKDSSVSEFAKGKADDVWCEFDINLSLTSFRPGQVEVLLADEDGSLIVQEESHVDDNGVFIDMNNYENQ